MTFETVNLYQLAEAELQAAKRTPRGRSNKKLHGDSTKQLKQILLSLIAGEKLPEHNTPTEATLLVVTGEVSLSTEGKEWFGNPGDYLIIPPTKHDLTALTDSTVLLTVVN